jgi:hypothetical protein
MAQPAKNLEAKHVRRSLITAKAATDDHDLKKMDDNKDYRRIRNSG